MKNPLSRRSAIALIGATTVPATAIAAVSPIEADPIFAMLDAHSRATARVKAAVHAEGEAEVAIPKSQRSLHSYDDIPESCTDHPDWIKVMVESRDANDSWDDARYDLLTTMPTTMAGLVALLLRLGRNEWKLEETAGNSYDEGVYNGATRDTQVDDISDAAFTFFDRLAEHLRTTPLVAQ